MAYQIHESVIGIGAAGPKVLIDQVGALAYEIDENSGDGLLVAQLSKSDFNCAVGAWIIPVEDAQFLLDPCFQ